MIELLLLHAGQDIAQRVTSKSMQQQFRSRECLETLWIAFVRGTSDRTLSLNPKPQTPLKNFLFVNSSS